MTWRSCSLTRDSSLEDIKHTVIHASSSIHTCTHVHTHMYTRTHGRTHTHTHTHTGTHTHAHTHARAHMYTHTHAHHTHARMLTHTYTCSNTHTHIHTHTCTCSHTHTHTCSPQYSLLCKGRNFAPKLIQLIGQLPVQCSLSYHLIMQAETKTHPQQTIPTPPPIILTS